MIPTELFPAPILPSRLQNDVSTGRRRKDPLPRDLAECPLVELVQWECNPDVDDKTRCWPVKRLFRRCETAAGRKVNIEITAVERRLEEIREREMEVRRVLERV